MKKIGILALALIMAVGSLGVGLAHWSGTLDINGTVTMEDFCFGFYQVTGGDPNVNAAGDPIVNIDTVKPLPSGTPGIAAQDIGWSKAELVNEVCICDIPIYEDDVLVDTLIDEPHYSEIWITLGNVYPGYYVDYEIHYHNCGLPIRVLSLDTSEVPDQIKARWTNGTFPYKMETCQSYASSLELWCLQPDNAQATNGVQPGQSYTFKITIAYEQWQ